MRRITVISKTFVLTAFSLTEQGDTDFIEKSLQDSEKVQVQTLV